MKMHVTHKIYQQASGALSNQGILGTCINTSESELSIISFIVLLMV